MFADLTLRKIVGLLFNTRLKDTNCALKMIRTDVLKSIKLHSNDYSFPTEVCLKIENKGIKMLEKTNVMALASLFVLTAFTGCLGSDTDEEIVIEKLIVAYEVKEDYENPDENPQILADYLANKLDMEVELYPITSEGSILEALRFGHAHIAFMDGAAAWVGWQQYGLDVLAADQKSDGRTYYEAHAWVKSDSEMAAAFQDDDPSTDPFTLLESKTSCHTRWLK